MSGELDEVNRQLFEYAIASDTKDWERLASLFTHGKFFFANEEGPAGVLHWGKTVVREDTPTQHAISTVTLLPHPTGSSEIIRARNYLTLFAQDKQGQNHTVSACWFENTWEWIDGQWRWRTHNIVPIFRGDWTLIHKVQQFSADHA